MNHSLWARSSWPSKLRCDSSLLCPGVCDMGRICQAKLSFGLGLFYKEQACDGCIACKHLAPAPIKLNPSLFGCGLFTFLDIIITFIGFLIHFLILLKHFLLQVLLTTCPKSSPLSD